jgi:predicted HNH restriction endonuclease
MMSTEEIELFEVQKLANALRGIEAKISKKQFEDLRQLYGLKQGMPFEIDQLNRPQGPTIHSCKMVGSALTKYLGDGPKYGMSWTGYVNELGNWSMRENIREALNLLGWFGPSLIDKTKAKNSSDLPELPLPLGNENPEERVSPTKQRERDDEVRDWVLSTAKGICECCGQKAPFESDNGLPYLEVHHVRHLANGGSDTISNAVALCPNCHRELHHGKRKSEEVENLYASIPRLKRE